MKRIAYFLTMALMLPLFAACSDDTEEVLNPVETRTSEQQEEANYYWSGNKKMYFKYLEEKTFIYFHSSNKETVLEKLENRGIKLAREDTPTLMSPNPDMYTNKGENFEFLFECMWTEVYANYKDVIDIPEILDACSGIYLENWGVCSGTSVIYVYTTALSTMQTIAEEYNVHIFGTESYFGISYLICDKNSKGNALEIAKDISEKRIAEAEPAMAGTAKTCEGTSY